MQENVGNPADQLLDGLERLRPAVFLVLCAGILVLLRLPSFLAPLMDSDEAVRAVGAGLLLKGEVPYLGFIDNKPPLTFWLFALGGGSVAGARILAALFTLGTALLAGAVLHREREGVRRLATVLYLLFSAAWLDRHFLTANTEVFMNLPLAAALWFSVPRDRELKGQFAAGLLAGICFAVAALARPTALFAAPVAALFWFLGPERSRQLFVQSSVQLSGAVLGGAAGIGACALYFHSHHALREFFYWSFLSGGDIGATGNTGPDFWRRMSLSFLPWVLSAGLLWWGLVQAARRELRRAPAERDYGLLMLAAVTVVTVLPCSFGGRWRAHYYLQFLPSLVPVAAVWTGTGLRISAGAPGRLAAVCSLAVVPALLGLLVNLSNLATGVHERRIGEEILALSDRWKSGLPPDGKVFVWGYAPGAYLLSGREPASRYLVPVTRVSGYAYGSDAQKRGQLETAPLIDPVELDRLIEDLEKNRPVEIADLSPGDVHGWGCCPMPPPLASWVASRYREAAPAGRVSLWRRIDLTD